jgi:hypothetical protein
MEESLINAREELKRADHLIFVSLKYTRTVDVIKSIVKRLINAFDCSIEALLLHSKEKKLIEDMPQTPRVRAQTIKSIFEDDLNMKTFMELYVLFRKIDRARFEKDLEFRRHVTMTAYLDEGEIEITIDIISDYFEKTKEFVRYVQSLIHPENE